jgi:hypothetical protein
MSQLIIYEYTPLANLFVNSDLLPMLGQCFFDMVSRKTFTI